MKQQPCSQDIQWAFVVLILESPQLSCPMISSLYSGIPQVNWGLRIVGLVSLGVLLVPNFQLALAQPQRGFC
jgi:hypothetical protein